MDMKVYVSCYIPSIKQTVMRIIYIGSECTILEARDQILQALGLGEKKVLQSLGLEREEYLFSGTQVYIESLHTHIDVLHLPAPHRLEPCYTLQEEFMRHEHRSPKPGDIFKLRLLLPKFNEDLKDEAELAAIEAQQGRKRSLEEANCEAVIKKAKLLPQSMVSSIASLREHLKTADPLSRPEWMELNLPVADIAKWASTDNRFATNNGRFAYMGRVQYHKLRTLISQLLTERERSSQEVSRSYDSVKSPGFYTEIIGNILVVGPAGTGKSHVLAAAVSDFTEEFHRKHVHGNRRKRVVSIMDCGLLQQDRAFLVIRDALFVAFGDDDQSLTRIGACMTSEQLVNFCENTEDQLLWLLDQWQCVEGDNEVKTLLFRMCCNHCMVRVASASCDLVEKAFHAGQPPAKLFLWDEGLGDEELECWGRWKFVSSITDGEKTKELLDDMELQILLDATGRLPVYLSAWYDALKETIQQTSKGERVSFEFAMKALQSQPAVDKMREDLSTMFENAVAKGELAKLVDGIGKYLFGSPMTKPLREIDIRYFRITDGVGAPSCGLVGSELARLIQKYKQTSRFFDSACLSAIRREFSLQGRKHPVIGGALLERAVIGLIAERALVLPLGNMTRLCPGLIELEYGAEQAAVEDLHMEFLKGGKEEALFMVVPHSATYKGVDAVLLGFRRESKGCHMYIAGVQITIGKLPKHRLCRKIFMKRACVKWVPSALNMEEDVSWSMNWVIPEVEMPNYPGQYTKEKDGFEVRSRSNIGKGKVNNEVDCLECFTTFRQVDTRLGFLDAFKFRC